jgi:hypothetical protein
VNVLNKPTRGDPTAWGWKLTTSHLETEECYKTLYSSSDLDSLERLRGRKMVMRYG